MAIIKFTVFNKLKNLRRRIIKNNPESINKFLIDLIKREPMEYKQRKKMTNKVKIDKNPWG